MLANDDLGNLGRLGKQMFQYASLRGLAQKHGYDYCLPPEEVIGTTDDTVKNSDITMFECFNIPDAPRNITNFPKVMERVNYNLDELLWDRCPDNVSLFGYFQTEKYFKHIEQDIRNAFTFVDEIMQPSEDAFRENFGNSEVVSLHIRRTDYVQLQNHHPLVSIDFYEKSLDLLPQELSVMIFSDDINWCKSQKMFDQDRFIFVEGNNSGVDLCLQSLCTYHIIANSSFSWWGAWLSKSKKIIAPSNWAGSDSIYKNVDGLKFSNITFLKND